MAFLEHRESGRRHELRERTLLGRSGRMDIHVPGSWVSAEHAVICWEAPQWRIRDLGSRNGTTLNGRPLETRRWHPLTAGAQLAFGQVEEEWILVDAGPPQADSSSGTKSPNGHSTPGAP